MQVKQIKLYRYITLILVSVFFLKANFLPQVQNALDSDRQREEFSLNKVDKLDDDSMLFVKSYVSSNFGLYAYKANYVLPFSYSSKKYLYWHKDGVDGFHQKQYETEFQISIKKPVIYNLFGLNETLTFAYTQTVWWQVYSSSAPFRETNYEPEVFVTFPTSKNIDKMYGLKGLRVGYLHQSNGQDGLQSRSWNRLYLSSIWQYKNLFTNFRLWYRIPEDKKTSATDSIGDDNPDIQKYLGYGDLSLSYIKNKNHFTLLLRNNFRSENKGAIKLTYSTPIGLAKDTFLYVKAFSGYGESLIDYNRNITKLSIGFSFSRGIF